MNGFLTGGLKEHCSGCGACLQICPKNCISFNEDQEGFFYPEINKELCVGCKLCERVCPFSDDKELAFSDHTLTDFYGGHLNDKKELAKSTSGGIFTAACKAFCKDDYAIFGAVWTKEHTVRHEYATDIKDIDRFRKSKYTQSVIGDSFVQAKSFLEEWKRVVFSGTPCQIAGLVCFLGKDYDNLLTLEVICHGVPSNKLMRKHIEYIEGKEKSELVYIDHRDKKKTHWDYGFVTWKFKNGQTVSNLSMEDEFKKAFVDGLAHRPSCYKCKFAKADRVADITMGDLWGGRVFAHDFVKGGRGTSLIFANTTKAKAIISELSDFPLIKTSYDVVKKYNYQIEKPMERIDERDTFILDLDSMEMEDVYKKYISKPSVFVVLIRRYFPYCVQDFAIRALRKIRRVLKK